MGECSGAMTPGQAPSRQRKAPVYGLDVVRLLAAVLVVVYHLGFKAWAIEGSSLNEVLGASTADPPGWRLTWCGWIGVQVFFVVSGAVIAYSARGASARGFARRRVARLLPALLIAALLALPVAISAFGMAPAKAVWLALKTVTFMPWGPWIIGQFWTIPIELCFYALVCVLLASGRSAQGMRGLVWGLGCVSCGYWLAVAGGLLEPGGRLTELLLLQHGVYFAIGMVCARLGSGELGPRHLALAIACVAAAAIQVREAAVWEMAGRSDLAVKWLLPYAIWLAATALVALSFLYRDAIAARVEVLSGALRLAGLSTYPLYLVHIHVGGAILLAAAPLGILPALLAAFAGSLLASLAIAAWLEPPLHGIVRSVLGKVGRSALALPGLRA
ncbi:acyltransferase family protein [Novosphingobium sp. BL-52-GroH]|uniref:acyltransferase family protein n=1 Tax=Novosphingobium sp. BL-52-GroH TaxID=3349877 RepID=UPI00384BB3B3